MRKFRQAIEEIVEAAKTTPLPDYDLVLEDRGHDLVLVMRNRSWKLGQPAEAQALPA
jgi:hypothetical protein